VPVLEGKRSRKTEEPVETSEPAELEYGPGLGDQRELSPVVGLYAPGLGGGTF